MQPLYQYETLWAHIARSSLTVSLNYALSTKPIYAAFATENIHVLHVNYPPSRMSGSANLPDLLDTTEHEDAECSLYINMKTFLRHLFYSNPKLMQAFLYCALVRELNILCMTVT